MLDADRWVIPFFRVCEFACPGEDVVILDGAALLALHTMRMQIDRPIRVTSAYRTKEYNAKLKDSSSNSLHIQGRAFDLKVRWWRPVQLAVVAKAAGFTEIISYEHHLHVAME